MSDGMSDGTGCSFSLETFCHLPGAKIQKDMYFYSLLVYTEVRDAFLKIVCRQRSGCMAAHSAEQIARWFLAHNRIAESSAGAESISNLKLQKLLYYAQGCFLATTGNPLFPDKIVAWQHGPVVESVYRKYKENGSSGIPFDEDFDFSDFSKEENDLLTEVYDVFGQYSAWKLRNMTHEEAPWKETPPNEVIPNEKIKDYFEKEYMA